MRSLTAWLLLVLCLSSNLYAVESSPIEKARIAFDTGSYEVARDSLLQVTKDGHVSAELCHNLGNAEYKLDNEAQAVLWYRRALALNRWLPETQQNFRFLIKQLGFLNFQAEGIGRLGSLLKRVTWQLMWQLSGWLAILTVVWLIWIPPPLGRRWPLVVALSISLISLGVAVIGYLGNVNHPAPIEKRLIVMSDKAAAFTAPAEAAATVISLPPGSEVFPLQLMGNWYYCDLPGGLEGAPLRGWVRAAFLEPLWPWAPELVQ